MRSKVKGVVVAHTGRGKKLGYPTANIEVPPDLEEGVFIGLTHLNGKNHPSIIFIGAPPTFNETQKRLESHILDFSANLYGQEIEVELLEKVRENIKFKNAEALIIQIKKDEEVARNFFVNYTLEN